MKIDPYRNQQKYIKWKEKAQIQGIEGIGEENSRILMDYILDMENGINVATSVKKGPRSYSRLNGIKQRLIFLVKAFENRFKIIKITKIEERQLFSYFNDMRRGNIRKKDGGIYASVAERLT